MAVTYTYDNPREFRYNVTYRDAQLYRLKQRYGAKGMHRECSVSSVMGVLWTVLGYKMPTHLSSFMLYAQACAAKQIKRLREDKQFYMKKLHQKIGQEPVKSHNPRKCSKYLINLDQPEKRTLSKGGIMKFKTDAELRAAIQAYFSSDKAYIQDGDETIFAPTPMGMAAFIGVSIVTYRRIEKQTEFMHVCEWAKTVIGAAMEQRLYKGKATGVMFALRNQFKNDEYSDAKTVNVTGGNDKPTFVINFNRPEPREEKEVKQSKQSISAKQPQTIETVLIGETIEAELIERQ